MIKVFILLQLIYVLTADSPMRNFPSDAPLHTLSTLYDVPVGFIFHLPPSFEAVYSYICGRRRVAVARYRICLVLTG